MAIVLEARSADGTVTRTPIEAGRNSFRAQPGMRYRIIDDAGTKIDDAISIRRIGNDLVINGLPEDRLVEFDGFFSRCTPQNSCELMLENLGENTPAASITPASEPLAAQRDGSFLMYAGKSAEAVVPVAPEAEPPQTFRTVGLVVAGLALAGAGGGGGGGGGGGSSAPAPVAPTLTSVKDTSDQTPVLSGTGAPGSTVAITIVVVGTNQSVSYQVPVDANGNWTVDTGTAAPSAGAMPFGGFPNGALTVLLNAPGTGLPVVSVPMTVDTVPPAAPVIGPVADDDIVNGTEKAAGVTINGTAEAGARVTVTWGAVTHTVDVAADGTWAARFEPAEVPPDSPTSSITARATDPAGNVGDVSAPRTVVIDSVSTVIIASVTGDDIVNSADRAASVVVSGSAKPNASILLTWGSLSQSVTANGAGVWTTTVATADVPADGSTTITAVSTDSSGNVGTYSRTVLIDTAAPTPPAIVSIPEAAGGLNAAEAADGTVVNVSLAGSTAVAGDTLIVHWGTQNVTRVIAAGEAGTTIAVTIPTTVIAAQGNGNVSVTASVNDAQGNIGGNSAATVVSVDTAVPTLTISDNAPGTATGPVTFTFTFSEAVTGFDATDITVGNGTKGAFAGSGTTYTLVVTPTPSSSGNITVNVAAGAASDGAGNASVAPAPYTQPYNTFPAPTLTISDNAAGTTNAPVTFTFTFSEAVTGFDATDITVGNGTKGAFSGSGTTYTLVVTPTPGSSGNITIDVAAGAATGSSSGLGNTAAAQYTQPFDTAAPTLVISDNAPGTATGPVTFTFTFSEAVTGFDATDITVGNGTKGAFSGSGTTYTLVVTPTPGSSGNITVDVAAGAASDAAANASIAPAQYTQPYNTLPAPTLAISDSEPGTANGAVTFTFVFSEAVTGFAATDITVGNGTKGAFSGSGTTYTLVVTPTPNGTGNITVDVGAGAATGSTSGLGNTAPAQYTQPYDTAAPTLVISDNAPGTATGPVTFTFTFSEAVTGFDATDITVGNGTKGAFSGSGTTYTLVVTPTPGSSGNITVDVVAGAANDGAGNASIAPAQYTQPYNTFTAPTVAIDDMTAAATTNAPVTFTFTFSEPVTGFAASDITVGNGTKGAFAGSGDSYTLVVTPTPNSTGNITVDVGASVATGSTSGLGNIAAAQHTQAYDTAPPTQTLLSFTVTDNVAPDVGAVPSGSTTDDTTPTISLTLSAVLQSGETLQILRDGTVVFSSTSTASATFGFTDNTPVRPLDDYQYTGRVVDAAGNIDTLVLNHLITVI